MKVWIVNYHAYDTVSVYSEETDMMEVESVDTEMGYLWDTNLQFVYDDFIADYHNAIHNGRGSATIDNRISIELMEVKNG